MSGDIPLTNPTVTPRDIESVSDMLHRGRLVDGHCRAMLEQAVADAIGIDSAIAVASASEAFPLILQSMGVRPGDDVILPALGDPQWLAAVQSVGAIPRFADCNATTQLPSTERLDDMIQPDTRLVVIGTSDVGVEGMQALAGICGKHEVPMVELVGSRFGSRCGTKPTGSIGRVSIIDFSPASPVSAGGGAVIVTNDGTIAAACREAGACGTMAMMAEPCAALGLSFLHRIEEILDACTLIAQQYTLHLSGIPELMLPATSQSDQTTWSRLVVRLDETFSKQDRDEIIRGMQRHDIATSSGMADICTLHGCRNGHCCPMASSLATRSVSLPMHTGLTKREVELVCQTLRLMIQRATFRRTENN